MHILAKRLYELLKQNKITIATAESCTGGMIGASLTSVPGMSKCYGYGVITYSNEAKIKLLGVSETTLKTYGAVSEFTACEMAEGALKLSDADIAISVTGIAGPGGGTKEKPVGLVYIGVAQRGKRTVAFKNNFSGTRDEIRQSTLARALEIAIEKVQK